MNELEKRFQQDMLDICDTSAREINYNPTRFRIMIYDIGGLEAAKKLIAKDGGTEGFTKLWENKRLDLSVEAHVLIEEYDSLFTDEEKTLCKQRLQDYGFFE